MSGGPWTALLPPTSGSGWLLGWVGLGAGAAFVCLGAVVAGREPGRLDSGGHEWAVANRGDANTAVARGLALMGSSAATLPVVLLVGAAGPDVRRSFPLRVGSGLALAGVTGLGIALRTVINTRTARRRPEQKDWVGAASGSAFPSGHTSSATLCAAACAWALAPRTNGRAAHLAVWTTGGVFALAVGWSRVWVGVHWPSDVLGGWLYAVAWSAAAVAGTGWLRGTVGNR